MQTNPSHQYKISIAFMKQFFCVRQQYLETLVVFLISMLKERTTNVKMLSLTTGFKVQTDSVYKRFLRFLYKISLGPKNVMYCIIAILGLTDDKKLTLILDRTYWTYGKSHQNFLYLAIMFKGYAIPIDFVLCALRKKGHSSCEDRKILIDRFIDTFGLHRINYIIGDREFMGTEWLQYLQKRGICFVQRLKESNTLTQNSRGEWLKIKDLVRDLKPGEVKSFGEKRIIKSTDFESHLTVLRTAKGELVGLAHSETIEDPCYAYRFRWGIELAFRSMKSHGFNMEETSITKTERLTTLFQIVSISCAFAVLVGETVTTLLPIHLKKHGYKAKCVLKQGIEVILSSLWQSIPSHYIDLKKMIKNYFNIYLQKPLFSLAFPKNGLKLVQ